MFARAAADLAEQLSGQRLCDVKDSTAMRFVVCVSAIYQLIHIVMQLW